MKKLLTTLIFFVFLSLSIDSKAQRTTDPTVPPSGTVSQQATNAYKNAKITYELISSPDHTWGYHILVDDKLAIAQPFIPAVSGNQGFKTSEDAEKIAKLMIGKMKSGQMPPSVTLDELKYYHIIN